MYDRDLYKNEGFPVMAIDPVLKIKGQATNSMRFS